MTPQEQQRWLQIARECGSWDDYPDAESNFQFSQTELFSLIQRIQDEQKRRDAEICKALASMNSRLLKQPLMAAAATECEATILATIKDKP